MKLEAHKFYRTRNGLTFFIEHDVRRLRLQSAPPWEGPYMEGLNCDFDGPEAQMFYGDGRCSQDRETELDCIEETAQPDSLPASGGNDRGPVAFAVSFAKSWPGYLDWVDENGRHFGMEPLWREDAEPKQEK